MNPCRARWDGWTYYAPGRCWYPMVFMCAGSRYNPDPCELHGCGTPITPEMTRFRGALCRCPTPTPEAVSA